MCQVWCELALFDVLKVNEHKYFYTNNSDKFIFQFNRSEIIGRVMEQIVYFGLFIFFFSAVLQGLTGFGFSILAVPILLIYSMIINVVVQYSSRKAVDLKKIWILLLAGIVTIVLTNKFLKRMDILLHIPELNSSFEITFRDIDVSK